MSDAPGPPQGSAPEQPQEGPVATTHASEAAERWTRAQAIFHTALDLPADDRTEYLVKAAGADETLRAEVESLLAADAAAPAFLDARLVALPSAIYAADAAGPARRAWRELGKGERLGAYRVVHEIGRGGMGVVYLANDEWGAQQVALKVLDRRSAAPSVPERFEREVRVAIRLYHPNVLPVLDWGETDGFLWFTSPFAAGGSLRDRLRRDGPLPIPDALRIARDVARALQHAHDHGIVHRDVKPDNVLFAPDGAAMLADFGISRRFRAVGVEADVDADPLTMAGVRLGTPAYMSPEQACGDRVDERSDVYSLACMLHELLTGRLPFDGATPRDQFARRMDTPAPSARAARPDVPAGVDAVVRRALDRDPQARVASAADLANALGAAI